MRIECFLIVSSSGNVRLTKRAVGLRSNEIAVRTALRIPDAFFRRPEPSVTITVEDESLARDPHAEATAELPPGSGSSGFSLEEVDLHDGLDEQIQRDLLAMPLTGPDGGERGEQ